MIVARIGNPIEALRWGVLSCQNREPAASTHVARAILIDASSSQRRLDANAALPRQPRNVCLASGRDGNARERQADVVYLEVLNRRTARMPRRRWTDSVT
jgi:hypothetical protein